MCGGFTCSKNTLLGLNITYVFVAFLLIGVATYGKSAAVIQSLPVLGGIVASGVFLLFVAVLGLVATLKHHQIMLFIYMLVLSGIFIIQFSVACAALSIDQKQEIEVIHKAWNVSDNSTRLNAETLLSCCGFYKEDQNPEECQKIEACKGSIPCPPCSNQIIENVDKAFNASGGLGLFFALTEIVGAILAYRFRNLQNPFIQSPSAQIFN